MPRPAFTAQFPKHQSFLRRREAAYPNGKRSLPSSHEQVAQMPLP